MGNKQGTGEERENTEEGEFHPEPGEIDDVPEEIQEDLEEEESDEESDEDEQAEPEEPEEEQQHGPPGRVEEIPNPPKISNYLADRIFAVRRELNHANKALIAVTQERKECKDRVDDLHKQLIDLVDEARSGQAHLPFDQGEAKSEPEEEQKEETEVIEDDFLTFEKGDLVEFEGGDVPGGDITEVVVGTVTEVKEKRQVCEVQAEDGTIWEIPFGDLDHAEVKRPEVLVIRTDPSRMAIKYNSGPSAWTNLEGETDFDSEEEMEERFRELLEEDQYTTDMTEYLDEDEDDEEEDQNDEPATAADLDEEDIPF